MSSSTGPVYALITASVALFVARLLGFSNATPWWMYALVIVPTAALGAWVSTKHEALVYRRVARNRDRADHVRFEADEMDDAWDMNESGAGTASGFDGSAHDE